MNKELKKQLRNELLEACRISKEQFQYTPTRCLQMLSDPDKDVLDTVIDLVTSQEPGQGFVEMYHKQALYLTIEAHIIKSRYAPLFTQEIIDKARKRLKEYDY